MNSEQMIEQLQGIKDAESYKDYQLPFAFLNSEQASTLIDKVAIEFARAQLNDLVKPTKKHIAVEEIFQIIKNVEL